MTIKSSLETVEEVDIELDFSTSTSRHMYAGALTASLTTKANILQNKSKVSSDLDIIPTAITISTKYF